MGAKSVCCLLFILFICHTINFFGFQQFPEYIEQYHDCQYLDTPFFGPEDSVLYNKDILIGIHTNLQILFSTKAQIDQIEQGGFFAVYGISTGKFVTKKIQVKNFPEKLIFHPHGIYLRHPNYLHVTNNSFYTGGERIETYKIIQESNGDIVLQYLHSTQMEPSFNGLTNDVLFLKQDRFLVGVWQVFTYPLHNGKDKPVWQEILTLYAWLLQIKATHVWDCKYVENGFAQCERVPDSGGVMMNSIAYDDKNTIIMTDTLGRLVKIFNLDENKKLSLVQNLHITSLPDNIQYDRKRQEFIVGGNYIVSEFTILENDRQKIKENPKNKSIVEYHGIVEGIKYNPSTKLFESNVIFSSRHAAAALAGAQIDESQKYLFLNSFADKSLVVCKKRE